MTTLPLPSTFAPRNAPTLRLVAMSAEAASDVELVARCARGDDRALGLLYDRHGGPAFGLAVRILRDAALAEDAVQEAFMGVWRDAARFDRSRASASTWILSLVHHKAVDLVRRERARPADPTESVPDRAAPGDVVDDVDRAFERERIDVALERLPAAQREVLELAYFGGFSQSELAERLGEPIGTVKSRTHTALGRLRALLAPTETRP